MLAHRSKPDGDSLHAYILIADEITGQISPQSKPVDLGGVCVRECVFGGGPICTHTDYSNCALMDIAATTSLNLTSVITL